MDGDKLREKIIDALHWTEYGFIGQGEVTVKDLLTQASEEQIADQILALLNTEQIDAVLVEARRTAKKQEGNRISRLIAQIELDTNADKSFRGQVVDMAIKLVKEEKC